MNLTILTGATALLRKAICPTAKLRIGLEYL